MRLLDLFSGIGGFSLAFDRAGFETIAFSEIEPFPCRVLAHRWPEIPNLGDIRGIDGEALRGKVDVVTFGSPCQDLSVAGKRAGFAGQRSSLFHEAIRVIAGARPAFAIWENVPGAYSSNGGWDFAAVLDAMADIGALDIAWTTLDAQYFGVPQRRRRIFLVTDFRGERASEILFEPEGLSGNPTPSGKAGEESTPILEVGARTNGDGNRDGDGIGSPGDPMYTLQSGKQHGIANELTPERRGHRGLDQQVAGTPAKVSLGAHAVGFYANSGYKEDPVSGADAPLKGGKENAGQAAIAFALDPHITANGDKSHDGHSKGGPTAFGLSEELAYSHRAERTQAIAFAENQRGEVRESDGKTSLSTGGGKPGVGYPAVAVRTGGDYGDPTISVDDKAFLAANPMSDRQMAIHDGRPGMAVRRLTPKECERLQGFPDDWTNIPGASDSSRYRALGNSVAVPVVEWITQRLMKAASQKGAA